MPVGELYYSHIGLGYTATAEPVHGPGRGLFQRAGSVTVNPVTPA